MSTPFTNTRLNNNDSQIDDLPREILRDIWSKLPLQAFTTSRYVCRSWNQIYHDLIRDPVFVSLRQSRANENDIDSNFLIVCQKRRYFSNLYLVEDYDKRGNSLKLLHTFFHQPRGEMRIIGSANGLICLSFFPTYNYFHICNPITGEILKFRNPKAKNILYDFGCSDFSGFFFDETTEVYKVVFTRFFNANADCIALFTHTLGSGIWRCNENFRGDFFENREAVFLKGAFHLSNDYYYQQRIDVIDIGDETIKSFNLPPRGESEHVIGTLVVVKGCLGWIETDGGCGGIVWIMKDYGVAESWSKEYVIAKEELRPWNKVSFKHLKKNGVFIRKRQLYTNTDKEVYYYVDKEEAFHVHHSKDLVIKGHKVDVFLYVGSLLSPAHVFNTREMVRMAAVSEKGLKEKRRNPYNHDSDDPYTSGEDDELSSNDEEVVVGTIGMNPDNNDLNAYDEEWEDTYLGSLFEDS